MTGRQPPPIPRGGASYIISLERRVAELEDERDIFARTLNKRDAENEELRRLLQEAMDLLYEVGERLRPLLPYVTPLYDKGLCDNKEAKPREK